MLSISVLASERARNLDQVPRLPCKHHSRTLMPSEAPSNNHQDFSARPEHLPAHRMPLLVRFHAYLPAPDLINERAKVLNTPLSSRYSRPDQMTRMSGDPKSVSCPYLRCPLLPVPLLFLSPLFSSSLALFAFWLRSSVVSVLFSLISETALRSRIADYSYFCTPGKTPLWACPWDVMPTVSLVSHCLQATRHTSQHKIFSLQSCGFLELRM